MWLEDDFTIWCVLRQQNASHNYVYYSTIVFSSRPLAIAVLVTGIVNNFQFD